MRRVTSFFIILLTDIFSLILSFYISYFLRVSVIPSIFNSKLVEFFPVEHFYKLSYMLFVFILIFFYEKLYTRRFDFFEEFVFIVRGLFISIVIIAVFIYFSRTYEIFARTIFILMLLTGVVIVPLARYFVRKFLIFSGIYTINTAIIGRKEQITRLFLSLKKLESSGYKISDTIDIEGISFERLAQNIIKTAQKSKLGALIFISQGIDKNILNELINQCESYVKEIKIVSDSSYLKTIGVQTEYLDELLIMRMANNLLSPVNGFFKRVFDIVVSLISIVVLFPFFIVFSIIIKIESPGPVLYIQKRFGKGGKKFKLLKFRSMYVDADKKMKDFLTQNPELKLEWEKYKKLKSSDPRVTKTGKFLRRFSIDEFPQIFNVLKGDMSIVGPRPYLIREKEEIKKSAAIIFRVKSGLTGLWQIRGRSELSFEDRLKLDEFYVRNWSFFLDFLIILKTFSVVLKGEGAY